MKIQMIEWKDPKTEGLPETTNFYLIDLGGLSWPTRDGMLHLNVEQALWDGYGFRLTVGHSMNQTLRPQDIKYWAKWPTSPATEKEETDEGRRKDTKTPSDGS